MTDLLYITGYRSHDIVKPAYLKHDTLYALDEHDIPSFEWLMANVAAADLIAKLDSAVTEPLPFNTITSLNRLLDRQPIWAAGVTYKTSEEARERESDNSTIYTRVYAAERPELFLKAIGYEVVSNRDSVGIRNDATWSVPEPELTVVINAHKEVVGFTIGNDMSSRDIEGENPLYLPQAKVYESSCALGPRIWLQPNATGWPDVEIHIEIERRADVAFSGSTSTSRLNRTLPELVDFLTRCKAFPYGALLMTGTGIVPPDDFTLQAGDVVRIGIAEIGELVNTVQVVGATA